jgi:hypothetical protein
MSKIEARGSKAEDSSDWNHAWNLISQLATARAATLRELGEDDRDTSIVATFAPIAPDQLARDMAEIERAAAALRRAEPALEPRAPDPQAVSEPRIARSIWLLVCVIWLTAAAIVSCAIGVIVLLLG